MVLFFFGAGSRWLTRARALRSYIKSITVAGDLAVVVGRIDVLVPGDFGNCYYDKLALEELALFWIEGNKIAKALYRLVDGGA